MGLELVLLWLQLAGAAGIILAASTWLAKSADIIAEKAGLGRSFIGVVLLATATSLPELGTGVSAITIVGTPDLAAGDAFGSNLVNLLLVGRQTAHRGVLTVEAVALVALYAVARAMVFALG